MFTRKRHLFVILSLLAIFTLWISACSPVAASSKTIRVALVVGVGGIGDRGFNDSGYAGVQKAKEELGVDFDLIEPRDVAEFEADHRYLAQSGKYDLIVGLGFQQADVIKNVSQEFPDQKWLHANGTLDGVPNVATFAFRDWENTFLAGALAAKLTILPLPNGNEDCTIGGVGGVDNPEIRGFAAGYKAGAKYINPECNVILGYVGAFNDPVTAKEMGLSMYEQGADIVFAFAGGSGLGVFKAAKERDLYAIGVDINQNPLDPEHIVYSAQKFMDSAIFNIIKDLQEGKWQSGHRKLGLAEGAIGIAFEGSDVNVPSELKDEVNGLKDKIISGELVIPSKLEDVDTFIESVNK